MAATPSSPPKTRPLPGVPEGLYRLVTAPRLIFPLYLTVGTLLLWSLSRTGMSWGLGGLLAGLGVLVITGLEYLIHRLVLHGRTRTLFVEIHRRHHAEPDNLMFAIIPLPASTLLLGTSAALTYGVSRDPAVTTAVGLGLVVGYLLHESSHYLMHRAQPPPFLGPWLSANHFVHHHRHPHRNYGFITPLWDHLLRTYQRPKALRGAADDRV